MGTDKSDTEVVHPWLAFFQRNWGVVKKSPFFFVSCLLIGLLVGSGLTYTLFEVFIVPNKNGQIELLERRINGTATNGEIARPDLTSFDGGLATSFDGQPTAGLPIGTVYVLYVNDSRTAWILKKSTHESDWKSGYIRGPDYDENTNPKVWREVQ